MAQQLFNFSFIKLLIKTFNLQCLIGLLNSQVYEKLNKLLYGENKIGRINLENLPIPYIDENIQIMIEKLIDDEKYDEIDKIISQIFDL